MTRRRKLAFAFAAVTLAIVSVVGMLFAADLYAHSKFQQSAGLNVWGYRGPTVSRKQREEKRIVVLGGSTAFGYGVQWSAAFPAILENLLNEPTKGTPTPPRVSVVNLASNNEGAFSFKYTLADYAYLDYDVALFYTGFNDVGYDDDFAVSDRLVMRHESALFRWTGYFTMLPMVMREKAMAIRYNGHIEDAFQGKTTVFKPDLMQRSTAAALEAASNLSDTLNRQAKESQHSAGESSGRGAALADPPAVACGLYAGYCDELYVAVKSVLDRGKHAVVVTEPIVSAGQREQQLVMREYLPKRFPASARLTFIDAGTAVDVTNPAVAPDGVHLTPDGNRRIAQLLAGPVRDALRDAPKRDTPTLEPSAPITPTPTEIRVSAHEPRPGTLRRATIDGRMAAWIPPGAFDMGSPVSENDRMATETLHRVSIDTGFWMDTTEVTNAAFHQFIQAVPKWWYLNGGADYVGRYLRGWDNKLPPPNKETFPVTSVPWLAASAYCNWAGKRLPTEAEWKYAARAGTSTAYWWGDAYDATRANGSQHEVEIVGQPAHTNPWGLTDMSGNLWEWTSSAYWPYPYRSKDGREDPRLEGDARRVVRGGSWMIGAPSLRSADRFAFNPRIASEYIGFRCLQS